MTIKIGSMTIKIVWFGFAGGSHPYGNIFLVCVCVKMCCIRMYTFGTRSLCVADYEEVEARLCLKMQLLCVR